MARKKHRQSAIAKLATSIKAAIPELMGGTSPLSERSLRRRNWRTPTGNQIRVMNPFAPPETLVPTRDRHDRAHGLKDENGYIPNTQVAHAAPRLYHESQLTGDRRGFDTLYEEMDELRRSLDLPASSGGGGSSLLAQAQRAAEKKHQTHAERRLSAPLLQRKGHDEQGRKDGGVTGV